MFTVKPYFKVIACFLGLLSAYLLSFGLYAQTDDEIKQNIIDTSINNYSGNCPCPYHLDRAGRRCGKRSAYSRPGGASPICYLDDVTPEMIQRHRENHHAPYHRNGPRPH